MSNYKLYYRLLLEQFNLLKSSPVWKLRWSTLGFHHDWDTKVYNTSTKSEFPIELDDLCCILARSINWCNFKPQVYLPSTLCQYSFFKRPLKIRFIEKTIKGIIYKKYLPLPISLHYCAECRNIH